MFVHLTSRHSVFNHHIRQLLLQLAGISEAGFELIAQRHQLIAFVYDARNFIYPRLSIRDFR